ncbi:unnamed protein product [Euphydryas editha]|uniref:Major facilitator superfamily (MFS) profile domain-containing protein n=1 Tax=Euphydryas editha TaxID=104508 RepID=A0AAU9UD74_EUPED|nr:unnamed protein product [Euphydryas editha]
MFFKNKNGNIRINQIMISACIYLGQALIGYTTTWSGPIIPKLRDLNQSPLPYLPSEMEISLIATFLYVGCIPAPYIMGWLSNFKGRKPCLVIGGTISIIAYGLLATANNLAMLYSGRILGGFGLGIVAVMNLVYIGEIASTSIRGILLTIVGISMTCGSILLFTVGGFLSYHASTYFGLSLSIAFTLGTLMLPESPIFYVLKDDEQALDKVLQVLGRSDEKKKMFEARNEFKSHNTRIDVIELFTVKANKRALFVVIIINVLQQCSGVMVVVFFSASIFEMAGSSIRSDVGMIVIGCFQLLGSTIAPFFVERLGRKTLLIISTIICSVSMFGLGLYFYLDYIGEPGINNVKWLPFVILILFFIGYDSGIGIIPNVLIGEMFTCNTRSIGSTIAMSTAWLAGFLVTTVFSTMLESLGAYGVFWFYSSTCACALLFTIFFIPETKSKSLLEIQKLMN